MKTKTLGFFLPIIFFYMGHSFGQEQDAEKIVRKSQDAFYYQGDDMKAEVFMELITKDGKKRLRKLTMLRKNTGKEGNQRYFLYFHEPGDVRRMSFMVWKYPRRDDDRWIFVPAINLVRRVAAEDKRSSFVGSDFTYEDVSGRDVEDDSHKLLREEKLGDSETYVIQSIPKEKAEYTRRISWIDRKSFLPLKEEYYDIQNQLFRVFTADKTELIKTGKGEKVFPTVMKRTMRNMQTGHRTEVTFTDIKYNLGIEDELFTERYLRNPPAKWIK